jgi:hypothetical protein
MQVRITLGFYGLGLLVGITAVGCSNDSTLAVDAKARDAIGAVSDVRTAGAESGGTPAGFDGPPGEAGPETLAEDAGTRDSLDAVDVGTDGTASRDRSLSPPDGADGGPGGVDGRDGNRQPSDVTGAELGTDIVTPPPSGAWQSRGIGGGGAFFVPEISPVGDQIYMSTDMGSVFFTSNFGASWRTIDFRVLMGGSSAQVRFTSDPLILYAIAPVAEVGVPFISRDGGATFKQLSDEDTTNLIYIQVDPNRADRLLVGNDNDLFFSGDSGASFQKVHTAADSGSGLILAGAFWDGSTIYVGTNDGILLSTNDGKSFALQSIAGITAGESIVSFAGAKQGSTTRFFAVTASEAGAGISGCETIGAGVYRLEQGQTSWTNLTSKLPAGHAPVYVGMATADASVAYVAGRNTDAGAPAVAKTSDGGSTWTSVFKTGGNQNIATGWSGEGGDKDWGYGECAEGFAVSRGNADKVIITDMGFVHVTSDGGASWRQAYVNPADQNPAGTKTPKARAYRGAGVEDTSVWWITWPDAATLFASFTDFTSLLSTDSGGSWVRDSQNGLTLNTTYQAVVAPSGTLYAPTSPVHDMYMSYRLKDTDLDKTSGAVMQSADKGSHWTLVHDFAHPVVFVALDPQNPDIMYASVVHHTAGGVFRTTNLSQGASSTWTRLPNPPRTEGHPYNLVVLNDGSLVATYSGRRATTFTESSGVFVLPSGGSSWTDVSASSMHYWVKDLVVDPSDPKQNTWYVGVFLAWDVSAAADSNGLYRTTNRGQSWQRILAGHNVESVTVDPNNPAKMFVTTESDGLWQTNNLNTSPPTFAADPDFPFMHPLRVFFNPFVAGEVWVASFGGGMRVRQF